MALHLLLSVEGVLVGRSVLAFSAAGSLATRLYPLQLGDPSHVWRIHKLEIIASQVQYRES